jgi:hypothetical protein
MMQFERLPAGGRPDPLPASLAPSSTGARFLVHLDDATKGGGSNEQRHVGPLRGAQETGNAPHLDAVHQFLLSNPHHVQ